MLVLYIDNKTLGIIKNKASTEERSVNSYVRRILYAKIYGSSDSPVNSQSVIITRDGDKVVNVKPDEDIIKQRRNKDGRFIKRGGKK